LALFVICKERNINLLWRKGYLLLTMCVGVGLLRSQAVFTSDQFIREVGDTGTVSIALSPSAGKGPWLGKSSPPREVWNGPYRFQSIKKQKDPNWENRDYIESGFYSDGLASGDWSYTEQITRLNIQDLNVSQLQYKIQTWIRSQKGAWRKGIRNGDWNYQLIEKGSENSTVRESMVYRFKNGWLNGPIKYETAEPRFSLSGQIADGMMIGDWYFRWGDTLTEHRLYEKGVLISLSKFRAQDTQQWNFPLSQKCSDALRSRDKTADLTQYPMSLTFSDGYHKQSRWIDIQKEGGITLERVQERIAEFLPEWRSQVGLSFGTNRCIYPLSIEEEMQLTRWLDLSMTWKSRLDRFSDTLKFVSKYPQQQALYDHLNRWLTVQYERWHYTKTWREIMENGRLVYYHRNGEIFNFAKELLLTDTLKSGEEFAYIPYADSGNHLLSFLVNNTEARMQATQFWFDSLLSIQKRYELSKFMLQMSVDIQKTHDSLWITCIQDSLPYGHFFLYLKDFRTQFLGEAFEQRYRLFLNEQELNREQALGDSLLSDLRRLDQLRYRCLHLEKMWRAIDTFYTEPVVDAFTFERVNVRNKKRLYEQFELFTKEEISRYQQSPLEERLASTMRLRRLFQYYLYLRDTSTTALERRLLKAKTYADRRKIWEAL